MYTQKIYYNKIDYFLSNSVYILILNDEVSGQIILFVCFQMIVKLCFIF